MRLVFIYGMPATGKLTIARKLESLTGFSLFHNHLVVDLLLPIFEFGSEPFVELREEIWLSVFERAARAGLPGMIFTFAPENTVRPQLLHNAVNGISTLGGSIEFVELICPLEELKQRIGSATRHEHGKLTSVALFEQLHSAGNFNVEYWSDIADMACQYPIGVGGQLDLRFLPEMHLREIVLVNVAKDPHIAQIGNGERCCTAR